MYRFKIELQPAKELDPTGRLMYLTICLVGGLSDQSIKLVQAVLEDLSQLNWFAENEKNIRNDELPLSFNGSCSIAEGLNLLYDKLDTENSSGFEALYDFRSKHGVRFAFRGQDLPDIFVAWNNNRYEVSCSDENFDCRYDVDINSLFEEIEKAQKEYASVMFDS